MIKTQSSLLKKIKPDALIKTKKTATCSSNSSTASSTPTKSNQTGASLPKAKKSCPSSSSAVKTSTEPSTSSEQVNKSSEPVEVVSVKLEPVETTPTPKATFTCSSCGFTTSSISFFKRHEAFHQNQTAAVFTCLACQLTCSTEVELEEHVKTCHGKEADSLMCLQCGFKAPSKQSLISHFKRLKHTKASDANTCEENDNSSVNVPPSAETDAKPVPKSPKKGRSKSVASNPYACKYCSHKCASENGINLHWKRCHPNQPLDFDFNSELQSQKSVVAKIYYWCLLCGVQGTFDELKEHSKSLHPNGPRKLLRLTGKIRNRPDLSKLKLEEPSEKKVCQGIDKQGESVPSTSEEGKTQSPSTSKLQSTASGQNAQTVFVVAQPPSTFVCVWCHMQFQTETEVIKHHGSHPNNVPLRYKRVDSQNCLEDFTPGSSSQPDQSGVTF